MAILEGKYNYLISIIIVNNKHYSFIVDKNQEPLRIDKFLLNNISNITRSKIQNIFKIYVNNFLVKKNYRVKPLDIITIIMDNTFGEEALSKAKDISLNIIYEDDVLVVINKPTGLVVQGNDSYEVTILHAIKYHLNKIGLKAKRDRLGLVHRLDRETSGLLLIAKNDFSLQHLTYQFFTRSIYRRYIALVWGNLEGYGTMKGHIGRSFIDRKRMEIFDNKTFGKHSVTHYKVLEKFNIATLVACRIDTGRTHQIRTHLTHLGHPIFNDSCYDYGDSTENNKQKKIVKNYLSILQGQFLHAQSFIFIHPITGKPMHFETPLPKKMYEVLKILRILKL